MKDMLSSIGAHVSHRVRNPFFGAFVVSWLVIHWKPICLIILSRRQIEFVVDELSVQWATPYTLIILPLLCATGYTFISPIFSNAIAVYNAYFERERIRLEAETKAVSLQADGDIAIHERYLAALKSAGNSDEVFHLHHEWKSDQFAQILPFNNRLLRLIGLVSLSDYMTNRAHRKRRERAHRAQLLKAQRSQPKIGDQTPTGKSSPSK